MALIGNRSILRIVLLDMDLMLVVVLVDVCVIDVSSFRFVGVFE